jgi:23S rRNA (pseudouridine1915-N3)-methyltransferase
VKFRALIVGRSRCKWANEAVQDYSKRIQKLGGVSEEHVRLAAFRGDESAVRAEEGQRLLKALKPRDFVVAMDERGEALNTEQFTALIDAGRQRGTCVFMIGGAYGLDATVRQRADRVVRLSSMVFNHEVARVVLYEQLYRSLTLLNNIPYHH